MNLWLISNFWVLSSLDAQSVKNEKRVFCRASGTHKTFEYEGILSKKTFSSKKRTGLARISNKQVNGFNIKFLCHFSPSTEKCFVRVKKGELNRKLISLADCRNTNSWFLPQNDLFFSTKPCLVQAHWLRKKKAFCFEMILVEKKMTLPEQLSNPWISTQSQKQPSLASTAHPFPAFLYQNEKANDLKKVKRWVWKKVKSHLIELAKQWISLRVTRLVLLTKSSWWLMLHWLRKKTFLFERLPFEKKIKTHKLDFERVLVMY